MGYQSVFYLVVFVPCVLVLYQLTPRKFRSYILLLASLLFYWLNNKDMLVTLLVTCVFVYGMAIGIQMVSDKYKKWLLWIAIVGLFGFLLRVKYIYLIMDAWQMLFHTRDISFAKMAVPLGISYYTLMAVGYLAEVYWKHIEADKNFVKVTLFLTFFPQIMQGPIARYQDTADELVKGDKITTISLRNGLMRVLWGLFKKFTCADRLATIVAFVFAHPDQYHGLSIVVAAIAYCLQLYLEFSGMIDVSIGIASCMNIKLPENFRQPFFAQSASEFWRRWHITLGTWLKTYVFYPVSTSKLTLKWNRYARKKYGRFVSKVGVSFLALTPVWVFNGIWHGPHWNYIFYGFYYLTILMLEVLLEPIKKGFYKKMQWNADSKVFHVLRWLRTLCIIVVGEMFFRADGISQGFYMFSQIFTGFHVKEMITLLSTCGLDNGDYFAIVLTLVIVFTYDVLKEKGFNPLTWYEAQPLYVRWSVCYGLILAIVFFGAYGTGYQKVDMIYAGF